MKKCIIALLLIAIISLAGCAGNNGSDDQLLAGYAGNNDSNDQAFDGTEKFNAYVELLNYMDGWFGGMLQSYFSIFGEDIEPSFDGNFEHMFSTFADHDMMSMHSIHHLAARNHANNAPDWGEVDARMLTLTDAVEAVMELYFVEMTEYYSNRLFEVDDFQLGREMHVRMIAYIGVLWDAYDAFFEAFQYILLEKQGADLPIFEEHGLMIHFYSLRMILTGLEILQRGEEPIAALEDLISLFISDLAALEEANSPAQRELEGISEMAASHVNMFITISLQMQTILEDALADGRSISATRFGQQLDSLISRYNLIISL